MGDTEGLSQSKDAFLIPEGDANAYRAELMGLYCMLCVLERVCTIYKIKEGGVKLGCHNDRAIFNARERLRKVAQKSGSADLVRVIRKVRDLMDIKIEFIQVKVHLDDECDYRDLDRASQLNIQCDKIAKSYLQKAHKQGCKNIKGIPHECCSLKILNDKWSKGITECWLKRLWEFISTTGIIVDSKLKIPEIQRLGD